MKLLSFYIELIIFRLVQFPTGVVFRSKFKENAITKKQILFFFSPNELPAHLSGQSSAVRVEILLYYWWMGGKNK